MTDKWAKDSWRKKPIIQVPDYDDQGLLNDVELRLSSYPPLVFAGEARNLKDDLARVCRGEAFFFRVVIVQKALQNMYLII